MATTTGESLADLERQAETNRAELAHTVDELYSRVTPGSLKADARNYARETGRNVLDGLEAKVRENPLQALAVAAGLAYPLWRFIARMPAPVLLIGAGLALSRRDRAPGPADIETRYRASYDDSGDSPGVLGGLTERATELGSQIAGKAQETMESVRAVASEKASDAADLLSDRYRSGKEAAAEAAHRAGETYARTRDNVTSLIERHPMLAGIAAFAVGGLVASALPVSRQENQLLGQPADEVKHRAQDLALDGLAQAGDTARQVYESAAAGLREEGVTSDPPRHDLRGPDPAI